MSALSNNRACALDESAGRRLKLLLMEVGLYPGEGVRSLFVRPGCANSKGIVFAYFFWNGVSQKGNFSGAGTQNMSKGEFLLDRIIIWSNFCV